MMYIKIDIWRFPQCLFLSEDEFSSAQCLATASTACQDVMHPDEEILAKYMPGLPEEETRFPMAVLPASAPPGNHLDGAEMGWEQKSGFIGWMYDDI